MSFPKGTLAGFAVGVITGLLVSAIPIRPPAFLITADKKERLSKKEAAALLNDVHEDRELLFNIFLGSDEDIAKLVPAIRLKALIDPRWQNLVERITLTE